MNKGLDKYLYDSSKQTFNNNITKDEFLKVFQDAFKCNTPTKRSFIWMGGEGLKQIYELEGKEGFKKFLSSFEELGTDKAGVKFLKSLEL